MPLRTEPLRVTRPFRYKTFDRLIWYKPSQVGDLACSTWLHRTIRLATVTGAMSDHMGFPGQQENGEPSVQERAASAVEHALQELKASNKRKRNVSDHHGADGKHLGSKRTSSSNNVNGNNHDANQLSNSLFSDSLRDSPNSHDFSALSQQLARHVAGVNQGLPDGSNPSSTAAAALAGIMPQLTVPQPTELSFASTASGTDRDQQLDSSFDIGGQNDGQNQHTQGTPYNLGSFQGGTAAQVQAARESSNGGGNKPPVGSEEWHKVRRDNHKEGELPPSSHCFGHH